VAIWTKNQMDDRLARRGVGGEQREIIQTLFMRKREEESSNNNAQETAIRTKKGKYYDLQRVLEFIGRRRSLKELGCLKRTTSGLAGASGLESADDQKEKRKKKPTELATENREKGSQVSLKVAQQERQTEWERKKKKGQSMFLCA